MSLAQSIQQAMNQNATAQSWAMWPTLTFGKHKGKTIDQVPTDYLRWCVGGSCKIVEGKPFLKSEIERCLRDRDLGLVVRPPPVESEPLNNTEGEQRLLQQIGQLKGELRVAREQKQRAEDFSAKVQRQLLQANRDDLRKECADLREEVAAMRRARAAGAGTDAKSWWAANRKKLAFLAHPDRGGNAELMGLLNDLNAKMK